MGRTREEDFVMMFVPTLKFEHKLIVTRLTQFRCCLAYFLFIYFFNNICIFIRLLLISS